MNKKKMKKYNNVTYMNIIHQKKNNKKEACLEAMNDSRASMFEPTITIFKRSLNFSFHGIYLIFCHPLLPIKLRIRVPCLSSSFFIIRLCDFVLILLRIWLHHIHRPKMIIIIIVCSNNVYVINCIGFVIDDSYSLPAVNISPMSKREILH